MWRRIDHLQGQKSCLEDHIKDQEKIAESQLNNLNKVREQVRDLERQLTDAKDKMVEKEEELSALNMEKENLQQEVILF